MAYGGGMGYHLHMPSYFGRTFTEYPSLVFKFISLYISWNLFGLKSSKEQKYINL